jgi:hypothetical protein
MVLGGAGYLPLIAVEVVPGLARALKSVMTPDAFEVLEGLSRSERARFDPKLGLDDDALRLREILPTLGVVAGPIWDPEARELPEELELATWRGLLRWEATEVDPF